MGTTIDIGEKLTGSSDNRKGQKKFGWIKYFLLVFIFASSVIGLNSAFLFEPMSLSYRFYTFCVFPPMDLLWRFLQTRFDALSGINLSLIPVSYTLGIPYFFGFLGIILLGRYYRRFWCRDLCPLGALFSIFGRFSVIQKKVSDKCIECGKCTKKCKMGAIPDDFRDFTVSECIYCFDCVKECPVKAISFKIDKPKDLGSLAPDFLGFIKGRKPRSAETSSGFSRRGFLEAVGLGAVTTAVLSRDHNRIHPNPRLVRPPAALPEKEFDETCIRCGECMKICITGGLQPSITEAGIEGFMTPRLIPAAGYCEEKCAQCGQVCPTGAIQKFEISDKPNIKLGLANINRSACLVWLREEDCMVCDEHCSYRAIYWKEVQGKLRPYVDNERCVGCGMCENKCPVKPEAAIVVQTQGENRVKLPPGQTWKEINPIPEQTKSDKFHERPAGSDMPYQ
jgi:ferredoxin